MKNIILLEFKLQMLAIDNLHLLSTMLTTLTNSYVRRQLIAIVTDTYCRIFQAFQPDVGGRFGVLLSILGSWIHPVVSVT